MRSGQGIGVERMFFSGKIPADEAGLFFEDLANMLAAGINLAAALRAISGASGCASLVLACVSIGKALERGVSLGQAMDNCNAFDEFAVRAIAAAGKAGDISRSARALAEYYQAGGEMRRQLLGAFGYPVFVLLVLVLVFFYMSFEVMPRLSVFLPAGAMESSLTRSVVGLSAFLRQDWLVVVFVLLGMGIFFVVLQKRCPLLLAVWASHVPLLSDIRKDRELAIGFFTLALMVKSGIPLDSSLKDAALAAGGLTRERMELCRRRLINGQMLSAAFSQDKYFPVMVGETLRIGEVSGKFEDYFLRVYQLCRRSLMTRTGRAAAMLRPALIVFCAGAIAILVFAFLRPLYANLSNVGMMHP